VKFGWRDSAPSTTGPQEPEFSAEVDQEFEDACLALAMSEVPNGRDVDSPTPTPTSTPHRRESEPEDDLAVDESFTIPSDSPIAQTIAQSFAAQ